MSNEDIVCKIRYAMRDGEKKEVDHFWKLLYEKNKGMIRKITNPVKRLYGRCEADQQDIESEAIVALWIAVGTYNANKKAAFTTWAYTQIQYSMLAWMKQKEIIKYPDKLRMLVRQYDAIIDDYKNKNDGQYPEQEYIFNEINKKNRVGRDRFRIVEYAKYIQNVMDLNEKIDIADDRIIKNMDCVDYGLNSSPIEMLCIKKDEKIIIQNCLNELNNKEYAVLYGLYFEGKKQVELAKELGSYKQQINRIRNRALKHLLEMEDIKNIIN